MLPPCSGLKRSLYSASFILLCMLGLLACSGNPKADSKVVAQELNKPHSDLTKESDERFLVNATEFSFKEILIGKLARQRATDQTVIDLAAMMEDAHREAKSALASLAIIKGMAIPNAPPQSATACYDILHEKTMEDFDLGYCALTRENHKDGIALFERAMRENHDPDIHNWASSMLPSLRDQLARATACESRLNPVSELIR